MINKRFRSVLLSLLGIGVVVGFVYYLYVNTDRYLHLLNISVTGVIMLFVLSLAFPWLNGIQNTLLYRSLGTSDFSHWDGFHLSATSSLANQLPLPGGVISKGYFLKRKYNLSYTMYTSSTLALFVCYLSLNGVVGLVILAYWTFIMQAAVSLYLWAGFCLLTISVLVFLLPLDRIVLPLGINDRFQRALEGWFHIRRHRWMVLKILVLQTVMVFILAVRYWIAFHMLSQNVSIAQVLLMSNASVLTQMVSLAPGGLGAREFIVASVASVIGFDAAVSVVAVGLDRLVSTMVKLLAGGVSTVFLGSQIAEISSKQQR
jgi:uncharacterized membrane protein YbhN (UPF0104 family)